MKIEFSGIRTGGWKMIKPDQNYRRKERRWATDECGNPEIMQCTVNSASEEMSIPLLKKSGIITGTVANHC